MFEKKNYDKEMLYITKRNKAHTCLYPNCKNRAIYSHAISKSISIDKIAEGGHVKIFNPIRYGNDKIPRFSDLGINDASAFNGFCHDHDSLFNNIDENEIDNLRDLYFQIYRSLSCFYYYEKIGEVLYPDIDANEAFKTFVDAQSTKDTMNIDQEKLKSIIIDTINKTNNIKNDELKKTKNEIDRIRRYFLNNIHELDEGKYNNRSLNEKGTELQTIKFNDFDYVIFYYITDFKIPVAINTMHNLNYCGRTFLFLYIVIPYENSNIIIGVIEKDLPHEYYDRIISLIDDAFKDKLATLNFIETLIITSPDDFYLKPSVINDMEENKLDFILNDFMFLHEFLSFDKYFTQYDASIFDELRRNIISENKNSYSTHELDKIHMFPERESNEVRKVKMMDKIKNENVIINSLNKGNN
ncbi:hypothetical protein [Xenorhabdus bovienii]|uniref:hypothetical protein n=1 Tax=Xenorhabdus bovienii TaxID=40576 RepID=UPI003DA29A7E